MLRVAKTLQNRQYSLFYSGCGGFDRFSLCFVGFGNSVGAGEIPQNGASAPPGPKLPKINYPNFRAETRAKNAKRRTKNVDLSQALRLSRTTSEGFDVLQVEYGSMVQLTFDPIGISDCAFHHRRCCYDHYQGSRLLKDHCGSAWK